ncbi:MAG: NfeD family protein [Bdellovibrionaceae bacterium]|nr:NfeD family protein [Pseudobdellovibrionaceae bacterium]
MDFSLLGYEVAAWQFFAALGLLFSILEVFTPGFVLLPIGIASFLTIPVTYFYNDWLTQLGAFGVHLILVFWLTIRYIKPNLNKKTIKTNVDSLIGNIAEVTEAISANGSGYVKLYGDRWQAYSESNEEFSEREKVKIAKVDGNKVVIKKINI